MTSRAAWRKRYALSFSSNLFYLGEEIKERIAAITCAGISRNTKNRTRRPPRVAIWSRAPQKSPETEGMSPLAPRLCWRPSNDHAKTPAPTEHEGPPSEQPYGFGVDRISAPARNWRNQLRVLRETATHLRRRDDQMRTTSCHHAKGAWSAEQERGAREDPTPADQPNTTRKSTNQSPDHGLCDFLVTCADHPETTSPTCWTTSGMGTPLVSGCPGVG